MMGVLGAKTRKNHLPMIRFAITIGIFQKQDIIAIGHIDSSVSGKNTGWYVEVIRKNRMLVCHPVSGRVFEYDQLVRLFLPGFDMGI